MRLRMAILSVLALLSNDPLCVRIGGEAKGQAMQTTDEWAGIRFPGGKTFGMSVKSKIDGTMQPCLIRLPRKYDPAKKYPLLVTLHGYNDGPILAPDIDSVIQIGPSGRGSIWYDGVGAQDVFECIDLAKRRFSVDADRVFLCGFSMGGCGTFKLAFRHPDVWAGCIPVCGKWDDEALIKNAENIAFWINAGGKDDILPAKLSKSIYEKALECGISDWRYTEHPDMGHSFGIEWNKVEAWLAGQRRTVNPKRVHFTTRDLNSDHAYWVWILEITQYGQPATIDARIDGQTVHVNTKNVSNYRLMFNKALIDVSKEIGIIENGVRIYRGVLGEESSFVRKQDNGVRKKPGLCGPIWDIYSQPCLVIRPAASKDEKMTEAALQCAQSFVKPGWMPAMGYRIVTDTEVTAKDIQESNLVLIGDAESNTLLREISDKLPIRWTGGKLVANGREYWGAKLGFVLIYPNPKNPEHYVLVISGNSPESVNSFGQIWPAFDAWPRKMDAGIFDLDAPMGQITWRMKTLFGSHWEWPAPASPGKPVVSEVSR